jgi:hypothetical protein
VRRDSFRVGFFHFTAFRFPIFRLDRAEFTRSNLRRQGRGDLLRSSSADRRSAGRARDVAVDQSGPNLDLVR